jgi:hypothetical protein
MLETIAYKVVEKKTRYGSNVAGSIDLDKYEYVKKYLAIFPKYTKGSIVKAKRGSLGIFLF